MLISVIICTYGRTAALGNLLAALESQSYRNFETLIVDGNPDPSPAREAMEAFLNRLSVRLIPSEKGLTRQRNLGLRSAGGDVVCFFDDDVTFDANFLSSVLEIFQRPGMENLGGLTGYDPLNFPTPLTMRWHLRRALGVIPKIEPGRIDHLGRAIPLSFLKPFSGFKVTGWLSGFCMIYRRAAIGDLLFDEGVATYGGEDRDFSMRVGMNWQMLICGDLRIEHHSAPQGRDTDLERNRQCAFGVGRRLAKYRRGLADDFTMFTTAAGDFVIDLLYFLTRPSGLRLVTPFVKMKGLLAGLRSTASEQISDHIGDATPMPAPHIPAAVDSKSNRAPVLR